MLYTRTEVSQTLLHRMLGLCYSKVLRISATPFEIPIIPRTSGRILRAMSPFTLLTPS